MIVKCRCLSPARRQNSAVIGFKFAPADVIQLAFDKAAAQRAQLVSETECRQGDHIRGAQPWLYDRYKLHRETSSSHHNTVCVSPTRVPPPHEVPGRLRHPSVMGTFAPLRSVTCGLINTFLKVLHLRMILCKRLTVNDKQP